MRKNRMMRLASALLILTMVTTCAISGTFAKYVTTATATDTARVAKWEVYATGVGSSAVEQELTVDPVPAVTFNLFETVKEVDATTTDADVKAGENLIAPGTGGQFKFNIKNSSEVNAQYSIALADTNSSNIPIEYSLDGSIWKTDIAEIGNNAALNNIAIAMNSAADSAVVYWRWAFTGGESANYTASQTDVTDTALGIAAQEGVTFTVTATITVTQVN